jgi:hypothetical protein
MAYLHPTDLLVSELNEMRDEVAALAREEKDSISYRAYLLQARRLRGILCQVGSIRSDADVRAGREGCGDDAMVEHYYLDMLADWLLYHERLTRDLVDDGTLEVDRLCARRHHLMIAEFCHRHAEALKQRSEELDPDALNPGP